MGRAGRNTKAFIKLLGSNADEAAQMFITKADELGRQVINLGKGKIDDLGTKLDDLAAKGEKVLSGDFGDVKKYFKSLLPGEYTLVATPEGQIFRIAKGELGETSLELAARNGDGVVHNIVEGTGELWDMPRGGGTINGRKYSEHALERMAPDTPAVRAELHTRAVERAEAASLRLGTVEYNTFINKQIDPRGIPPQVINDAINNIHAVQGKYPDTFMHQSTDVTVIVNGNGDVITVIPR